eukprot:5857135-Amphidinium_carterae.2
MQADADVLHLCSFGRALYLPGESGCRFERTLCSSDLHPGPETYQNLQLDLDRFAGEASKSAEVQESAVADRASEHDQLYLFVASDAAFANVDQISSQAGYVIGIHYGSQFHMWDCSSYKIKRVCRSTLGAEANALVEGAK